MKKQLKTILCILLAVVLLVGCGKAEKPETSSGEKFAEAKVEESSVQEASKPKEESSGTESKVSEESPEEAKDESIGEEETSVEESLAETERPAESSAAESSAEESSTTDSSAAESSAVEESAPQKEKVKYGAYAAEEGDVTINGAWYLPDNGWGFGYYGVEITSHLPGNNRVIIECSFIAADGAEIEKGNAIFECIAEGETNARTAFFDEPIEGYDHVDLTVYYIDTEEQSGSSDVEFNTSFVQSGVAAEVINKGNYVLSSPVVTVFLFDEIGALADVQDLPVSNNDYFTDGFFGIYVGGKCYGSYLFANDHPYASAKFYFSATRTDLTTQASFIGPNEIEILEQYTKGGLYRDLENRLKGAFVLKNATDHTLDFAYSYVLRDAQTGEFLNSYGLMQSSLGVLIPGQVFFLSAQFIEVEGHPDVRVELVFFPKEVDPNKELSISSNLTFDYSFVGRGITGTFTNNDPERTMSTYGFNVLAFDEAGELVCCQGVGFGAKALEPGESIYVEVLDIPYLLPEETFRVEVFPFVTS